MSKNQNFIPEPGRGVARTINIESLGDTPSTIASKVQIQRSRVQSTFVVSMVSSFMSIGISSARTPASGPYFAKTELLLAIIRLFLTSAWTSTTRLGFNQASDRARGQAVSRNNSNINVDGITADGCFMCFVTVMDLRRYRAPRLAFLGRGGLNWSRPLFG